MKRTAIKRIGKVGKANLEANVIIKKHIAANLLDYCEIGRVDLPEFNKCMRNWPLQVAHRHKRAWYKGDPILLSNPDQWVIACQNCHERIEFDAELTEKIFMTLRGKEHLPVTK